MTEVHLRGVYDCIFLRWQYYSFEQRGKTVSNDTLPSSRDGNPDCYVEEIVDSGIEAQKCHAI